MKIKILFFGLLHDYTGFDQEEAEVRPGSTVGDLWTRYEARFPQLRGVSDSLSIAVNEEIADRSRLLSDGDEVALMPPVSGGSSDDLFQITREPIPTSDLARQLKAPGDGAVVVFEGIVRDHSGDRKTLYLEYEGYEPMAVRKMEEIGLEAKQKFPVDSVGVIHRLGRVEIGETSVAIIVTSAHRRAAFDACHYVIDRLKETVPIWKKEYFGEGSIWVRGRRQTSVPIEMKIKT